MLKTTPYVTPPGDLDSFLTVLLERIRARNELILDSPHLNSGLCLDVTDIILDLLGVPEQSTASDPDTGEGIAMEGTYSRDPLHEMLFEERDVRKFIQAARAEGKVSLMERIRGVLATWDAYRTNDDQMIPPVDLFKQMDGIRTAISAAK